MKKALLLFLLVLTIILPVFSQEISVAALKGPTAMGMVALMKESEKGPVGGNSYSFTLEGAPDAITPKLIKGEYDIAAVPANLAAVLYNNTKGKVEILAVNTLGVLYIAENGNSIDEVSDLKGKTIYASGKGSTPEYALNYILSSNGLVVGKDVFIEWKSEHAECLAAISTKKGAVAMLPQPFLTTAMMGNSDIRVALDLNELWYDKMGSVLITGVVAANRSFVEENEEAVRSFLSEYEKSVDFTNTELEKASALVVEYGIVPKAPVAMKAIPECNIVYIDGHEMQEALDNYFKVLFDSNPKSVGGALPENDIYFL